MLQHNVREFYGKIRNCLSLWNPHALKSFTENNLALRPILMMALSFVASTLSPGQGLFFSRYLPFVVKLHRLVGQVLEKA